jgi:hypothetical protein
MAKKNAPPADNPLNEEAMRLIAEGASIAVMIPAGDSSKKKRGPNFYVWEDLMVAKAFVNVSMDAAIGNNQSSKKFWRRTQGKFMVQFQLYVVRPNVDAGDKLHGGRTAPQIENRFNKVMKVEMANFNKWFKRVFDDNPSGIPYKEHCKLALKRYNFNEKDPFKFFQCVPTLHKCPKFNPFDNGLVRKHAKHGFDCGEEGEPLPVGPATANMDHEIVMGANLARPMKKGCKERKRRKEKNFDDFDLLTYTTTS